MAALLEAKGLALATPNGRVLTTGLEFALGAGELLHVVGPNGAGKSTLLRLLASDATPVTGELRRAVALEAVAYLPQLHDRSFHVPVTLLDVLEVTRRGGPAAAVAVGLVSHAQLRLGWNGASGGERQRVLLTACFLAEPRLLLLDEPVNHLDDAARRAVGDALTRLLAQGAGIVIAMPEGAPGTSATWPRPTGTVRLAAGAP